MVKKEPYVVAVGLNDIDEYYCCTNGNLQVGDKCFVRFLEAIPGGMIANAACVMAKMGIPTYMLDTLGDDAYTPVITQDMTDYGVNMDYVEVIKGEKNCRTEIVLSNGERTILIYENDKPFVRMDQQKKELLENATYVYGLMSDFRKLDDYHHLFADLQEKGTRFMLDAESTTFESYERPEDKFFFDRASIISFNEFSLAQFCGGRDEETAIEKLIGDTDKIVITTLGGDGCVVRTRDRVIFHKAYSVEPVDTTGAGDTFNASFLVGVMNGWNLEDVVAYATAAAARAIMHRGAKTGAVDKSVVKTFMDENKN